MAKDTPRNIDKLGNMQEDDCPARRKCVGELNVKKLELLIQKEENKDALKYFLLSAPVESKSQKEKDASLKFIMKILLLPRGDEIKTCVDNLNNDEKELLLEYIYLIFETPEDGSSAQLLVWHKHIIAWRYKCVGHINVKDFEFLVQKRLPKDVLKYVLGSFLRFAPAESKVQKEKDASLKLVMTILLLTKGDEIKKSVDNLNNDEKELLLEYI